MAVQAVWSEPVSGDFPVMQGKYRELLQNHPLIRPVGPSNTLVSLVFWVEFPKHRNREFFQRNREFNPWNRELSGWIREPPYGPPRDQIGCPQGVRREAAIKPAREHQRYLKPLKCIGTGTGVAARF